MHDDDDSRSSDAPGGSLLRTAPLAHAFWGRAARCGGRLPRPNDRMDETRPLKTATSAPDAAAPAAAEPEPELVSAQQLRRDDGGSVRSVAPSLSPTSPTHLIPTSSDASISYDPKAKPLQSDLQAFKAEMQRSQSDTALLPAKGVHKLRLSPSLPTVRKLVKYRDVHEFDLNELPRDLFRVFGHLKERFGEDYALKVVFVIRCAEELHRAWHMTLLTTKLCNDIKNKFDLRMTWELGVLRLKFRIEDGDYELHRKVPYDYDSEFQDKYMRLAYALIAGNIDIHRALTYQSHIKSGKHTARSGLFLRSHPGRLILYPMVAATCTVIFFGGDAIDAGVAAVCGLASGFIEWGMGKLGNTGKVTLDVRAPLRAKRTTSEPHIACRTLSHPTLRHTNYALSCVQHSHESSERNSSPFESLAGAGGMHQVTVGVSSGLITGVVYNFAEQLFDGGRCYETAISDFSVPADFDACAAVTALDDATACNAVGEAVCTYEAENICMSSILLGTLYWFFYGACTAAAVRC